MLRDAVSWLLYSPSRLVAVAIPLAILALLGTLGLQAEDPAPPRAADSPNAKPAMAPSSRSAAEPTQVHTEHTASGQVMRRAALRFLDAYLVSPAAATPQAVPRSLRLASTPALWRGLRLTHPDALPRGTVARTSVDAVGPFSGTVTADLDTGHVVSLSVVAWERGWRVSDVRSGETG